MSIWQRLSETVQDIGGTVSSYFVSAPTAPERSVAFTIGMIALGAKMAKADGTVTGDEVKAFGQVFQVPEKDRAAVQRVFNLAKQDIAGFESYAQQVAALFVPGSSMLESVLDGLFHIAKADGAVHEDELEFLSRVAEVFGFKKESFNSIRARHVVLANDPYDILGVKRDASFESIKKVHRELVRSLHPDKHIADGMPEELVMIATERLARINEAFDRIKKDFAA
jgi:DnaJ like chaperone protein